MWSGANLSPRQIRLLLLSKKERDHRSRNRKRIHVFLSRYICYFQHLSFEEQEELVTVHNVRTYNDALSVDSTDTIVNNVKFVEVMKIAFRQWRYMAECSKTAWNKRAERLNLRKLPGWLVTIPPKIANINVVMESILLEWEKLRKMFKNAIERPSKRTITDPIFYKYGSERVELKTQTYKKFDMTLLLRNYLFGEDFCKVRNEVIKETKNTTLLHFAYMNRIIEIFTVEEQKGTAFEWKSDKLAAICTCGGKVGVFDGNGRKGVGFIMEERRNLWKIKVKHTNEICYLKKMVYNVGSERYDLNDFRDHS